MMELEKYGSFKSHGKYPVKREMEASITCMAEDLSLPKKLKRSASSSSGSSRVMCEKSENSRLPEGTFLKTGEITQVMDIQEPISKLRSLLENHLGIDLTSFQIWLQDKLKMLSDKSLGEQCIQSEGLAQVKVELKQVAGQNRINILDVLRYSEECSEPDEDVDDCSSVAEDLSLSSANSVDETIPSKWTIYEDINSLFPIHLPNDPAKWTDVQIHHWLKWAMQEFNIKYISDSFWNITGKQLSQMTLEDFRKKVPVDPQNLFWTHIKLLRECKIFAVVDKALRNSSRSSVSTDSTGTVSQVVQKSSKKPRTPSSSSSNSSLNSAQVSTKRPTMTGHNGQIQLWQFLLELLGDSNRRDVIQWVGTDGEFKLNDPELVAQMWGERKNKPKMNYEKLSRALRYYYHDGMIAKVHGRRFVYKFERKLKELIGLSTEELITIGELSSSVGGAEV